MGDRKVAFGILVVLMLVFALFPSITSVNAESNNTVPDDYPTLKEAINSAADGDTIYIREGTYIGDLDITKHISLKGQNPESTIIHGCIFIRTSNVAINSVKLIGFGRWAQLKTFHNGYGIQTLSGKSHSLGARQEIWGTTIMNCVFENWIIPIALMGGDGERVINNTIVDCDQGINLNTFDNVIANNTISCDGNGIAIGDQSIAGNLLYGNYISGTERGIVINMRNHDNDIIGNTISGCKEGIYLGAVPEGYGPCSDNTIFHNNFISNTKQVFLGDGSSNTWDNGHRSGGNYWSDYTGNDVYSGQFQNETGIDGIGDTPYRIDGDNKDSYPLMNPWNGSSCVNADGNMSIYEFDFSYGYGCYIVVVVTNSTFEDLSVDQNQISFLVSGPTGTTGVAKIIIPEDLTGSNFPVYLNNLMLLENFDYTKTYNGTHTIIDLTYSHSTHLLEITGINVIPEYSSWLIPTLLLVAVAVIVISKKNRPTKI